MFKQPEAALELAAGRERGGVCGGNVGIAARAQQAYGQDVQLCHHAERVSVLILQLRFHGECLSGAFSVICDASTFVTVRDDREIMNRAVVERFL